MNLTEYTAAVMADIESDGTIAIGRNPNTGCSFHFDLPKGTSNTGPPFFHHRPETCACQTVARLWWLENGRSFANPPFFDDINRRLRLKCEIAVDSGLNDGDKENRIFWSVIVDAQDIADAIGDMQARAAMVLACRRAIGMEVPTAPDSLLTLKARVFIGEETKQAEIRLGGDRVGGQDDDAANNPAQTRWYKGLRRTLGNQPGVIYKDGVSDSAPRTTANDSDRLEFWPIPDMYTHGPFECPVCHMIIAADGQQSWDENIGELGCVSTVVTLSSALQKISDRTYRNLIQRHGSLGVGTRTSKMLARSPWLAGPKNIALVANINWILPDLCGLESNDPTEDELVQDEPAHDTETPHACVPSRKELQNALDALDRKM
ncbi:hypothetical protein PG993_002999 [Apiospora rasikravindrae]|uniref:Uncharacterized protein n=1 Tax=Apiospora rasikravindrae TaxID=990691 RepID=A0ABR1TY95_9PEZI